MQERALRVSQAPDSLGVASGVGVAAIVVALLPIVFFELTLAAPLPFWLFVAFAYFSLLGFLFPVLAFLAVLFVLGRRPSFGSWILGAAVLFAFLTGWWIWTSWDYGLKYQGLPYTKAVTLLNAAVFSVVIGVAAWGRARNSWWLQFAALVLLFVALVWCSFPYLGEAP